MIQDRFPPNDYPNKFKQAVSKMEINRVEGPVKDQPSKYLQALKILLYLGNVVSIISLAFIVLNYIQEASDIDTGVMITPAEHHAEEMVKKEDVDVIGIRSFAASRTRYLLIAGAGSMLLSTALSVIGAFRRNYCSTFFSCILLMAVVVWLSLDIHWTYPAWFKTLGIIVSVVNGSLSYAYSCLIKHQEYEKLTLLH